MARQTLVIGLGQFGRSLALALAEHGTEVLAVDAAEGPVDAVVDEVADAVILDATNEEALGSLAPQERDACVVAIGGDDREGNIIVTALLRQLGARRIVARASDALHARILTLVGADEVIHPEGDYGERLAIRLTWPEVRDVMPLGPDLALTEIEAPESFWGRTLSELELPERFHLSIAAIRRSTEEGSRAFVPGPTTPVERGDVLVLVGGEQDARALTEEA